MGVLRTCFVGAPNFVEGDGSGEVHTERPMLTGIFGSNAYGLYEVMTPEGYNHSLIQAEVDGSFDEKTGEYQGCLRSIFRNESDLAIVVVDYPTRDFDQINPYIIIHEHPMTIFQGYNKTSMTGYTDILVSSTPAFDPDLWLLSLFSVLIMMSIFQTKVKLQRLSQRLNRFISQTQLNDYTVYEVLSLFIQQESFDYQDRLRKYLSILITMESFVLINYYCNHMSTDQVVVPKPDIVMSYADFADRPQLLPVFLSTMTDFHFFKLGKPELRQWWHDMVKRSPNQSEKDLMVVESDLTSCLGYIMEAMEGRRALIFNDHFSITFRRTVCRMFASNAAHAKKYPNILAWNQIDQKLDMEFPKTMFCRKSEGNSMIDAVIKRGRRSVETGLTLALKKQLEMSEADFGLFEGSQMSYKGLGECLSPVLIMEPVHCMPTGVVNLKTVFLAFLALNCLALLVLLCESRSFRRIFPKLQAKIRSFLF